MRIVVVEGRHEHDTWKLACDSYVRWGYCADCGDSAEVEGTTPDLEEC